MNTNKEVMPPCNIVCRCGCMFVILSEFNIRCIWLNFSYQLSILKLTEIVCQDKRNSFTFWFKTNKATFPMHRLRMINIPTACSKRYMMEWKFSILDLRDSVDFPKSVVFLFGDLKRKTKIGLRKGEREVPHFLSNNDSDKAQRQPCSRINSQ